jgi:hypothetical protein
MSTVLRPPFATYQPSGGRHRVNIRDIITDGFLDSGQGTRASIRICWLLHTQKSFNGCTTV